ncbi:hypothetical protein NMG60_11007804 [Bertholletia excelsa]
MGCSLSKSSEEDDGVILICKERKRLMKSVVKSRFVLATAHGRYNQALYGVAMAIRLFVSSHSSPPSAFLITLPENSAGIPAVVNPLYHQHQLSESAAKEAVVDEYDDNSEEETETEVCEHFYGEPQNGFGWDFFGSLDGDLRAVREAEGIPELEEDDGEISSENDGGAEVICTVGGANVLQGKHQDSGLLESPSKGRELLEALKDVEDHFVRVCECGVDVSRMLETTMGHLQSGLDLEEIKDGPNKIFQAITWRRSTSSCSRSCKSFLTSLSPSYSTWTEFKNDLFEAYGGIDSGSHSLTLGRLYAWEKKLYEEVKAGEQTRKLYDQKWLQLRNRSAKSKGFSLVDKTKAEIRELHSRILVAIRRLESISLRIQKLRDEELLPQLVELLHGLMRTWEIMLESHEIQRQAMAEVKFFNCPAYGKFCNDSHRLATLQLEAELQNWLTCFQEFVSAQKEYSEALSGWLSKFIASDVEFCSMNKSSLLPSQTSGAYGPPLFVICHNWLVSLEKLPDKVVTIAMKSFLKDVRALWAQQGEEQQQKRKVDGLAKELDKRVLAFQRAEGQVLDSKISGQTMELGVRQRVEYLAGRKDLLDVFKKKLDAEKAKHRDKMQETQRVTLHGFQAGFSSVFELLMEFSQASLKMYANLIANSGK